MLGFGCILPVILLLFAIFNLRLITIPALTIDHYADSSTLMR
ncbi:hypothetical protein ABIB82_007744 [Bradyrhizobium sp. i1.8.4]